MRALAAILALGAALASLQDFSDFGRLPPVPPEDPERGPEWLLVHGESEGVEELGWERIAITYLTSHSRRIVGAGEAQIFPASSRLVIGTPDDNPLVRELAPRFGLTFEAGLLRFRGQEYGRNVGLILCGPDPDGGGLLTLVTGLDSAGVHACFTIWLDITQPGYAIVRARTLVESGPLLVGLDLGTPLVVDLDGVVRAALAALEGADEDEARLAAARALAGWLPVVQAVVGPRVILYEHLASTLVPPSEAVRDAREHFASRDPAAEILEAHRTLLTLLGEQVHERPAPVFYLFYDLPQATNAKSFGPDLASGRPRVVLNPSALTGAGALRAAAIHESVHTLQTLAGERLGQAAMQEGVAVLLTTLAAPELPLSTALMWTPQELSAAEVLRGRLLEAFQRDAASVHARVHAAWMRLDSRTTPIPGSPTRAGYFVAYLAARAWLEADPARRPVDLLDASAAELLAALR